MTIAECGGLLDKLHSVGVDEYHKWYYQEVTICQMIEIVPTEAKSIRTRLTKCIKWVERLKNYTSFPNNN